jgi:hypothetical protein
VGALVRTKHDQGQARCEEVRQKAEEYCAVHDSTSTSRRMTQRVKINLEINVKSGGQSLP